MSIDHQHPASTQRTEHKSFGTPDETRSFERGVAEILTVGGTPTDIVRRLNMEITRIIEMPATASRFAALGITTSTKSVDEIMRWHLAELAKWKNVVVRAKIPLEN